MMTARQAMAEAIQSATSGDVEIARLWLDIARELREGSVPAKAPSRLDERPGDAADSGGMRCMKCGYFVKWESSRLIHTRTGQEVCPIGHPGPDDTVVHTYAALDDSTQIR